EGSFLFIDKLGGALVFAFVIWITGKLMTTILKKEALGFGDVKFFGMAGLWLGLSWLPIFMILSGLSGIIWGTGWRVVTRDPVFPFGPALILSFYSCLLLQGTGFSPDYLLQWLK